MFKISGEVINMPLVEKVDPDWRPAEDENLPVGWVIHIDDPSTLIREGKVKLAKSPKSKKKK